MKILTVCDHGNNRSVTLAHLLKYWDNDVIAIGVNSSERTLEMLYDWADYIITTDFTQVIPDKYQYKTKMFYVGPDVFPRPMNRELMNIFKGYLKDNKNWLCQKSK